MELTLLLSPMARTHLEIETDTLSLCKLENMLWIFYLKDGEQSIDNGIKVRGRSSFGEVELTSEELHSEQGEDEDEQKEE